MSGGQKDKIVYTITFCITSAVMYSNVKLAMGISLGHVFTFVSIIFAVLIARKSDVKYLVIITLVLIVSVLYNLDSYMVWFTSVYKLLTVLPLIVVARRASLSTIYNSAMASFLTSTTLALILILAGFSYHKFIIYYDVIPRFAALAIEPVSYAFSALILYFLHIFSHNQLSLRNTILFYIPMVVAVSTVIVVKVMVDILRKISILRGVVVFVPGLVIIVLLYLYTRAGDSIDMRLFLYAEQLKGFSPSFFGTGFYLDETAAGLPGIFRINIELGQIFFLFFIYNICLVVIRKNLLSHPILLIALILPVLTEAYGAPLFWLPFFLVTFRSQRELLGRMDNFKTTGLAHA